MMGNGLRQQLSMIFSVFHIEGQISIFWVALKTARLWGALKQCPRVRRTSHRVVRSTANTALSPP